MEWYGCSVNDFLVPKDQDLLDGHPSADSWSKWGPEGFDSPKDANATALEFNFLDESFSNEIELEPSLHDKDQSSGSSVCGGLPEQYFQQTSLSSDQPNYQLQDLSDFEQMDDIFLYKQLYKHEPVIAWNSVLEDLPCVENLHKSLYFNPENQSSNTPGEASTFVSCNSNSKDCLDIETAKGVDPVEHCSRDEAMCEQSSVEESILQNLEMVVAQFTEKTRICFRDALYRLAINTKQHHVLENQYGGLNMQNTIPQGVPNETVRSEDKKPMESETNSVDRAVANLMFNKMEVNVQDLPFTTSANSNQEVIGSEDLQVNGSRAWNLTQKFHYPHHHILQGDAEVPRFGQSLSC